MQPYIPANKISMHLQKVEHLVYMLLLKIILWRKKIIVIIHQIFQDILRK